MRDLGYYVDQAIGTLQAELAAHIATLNVAPGAPILPVPGNDRFLFGGEEGGPVIVYPAVEVAAPDRTHEGLTLGQAAWDTRPTVVLRGWLAYDQNINTFQGLYRAIMRFGHALIDVMLEPDAFGPGVTVSRLQERYRTADPQTNDRQDINAYALLIFNLDDADSHD